VTRACAQLVHFRKEDERLLRKLLSKVKAQADAVRHCTCCRPFLSLHARERLPLFCKGDTSKPTEMVLPTQVDKSGADGHKDEEMTKLKARACAAALPAPDRLPVVTCGTPNHPPTVHQCMPPGPGAHSKGCPGAQAILPKHNLTDEEFEKLLAWKHSAGEL
jgi:hypothetical protein